ncbi:MAG: hypothetical protein JWQ84_3455 [Mucilaginibacter sp.]|nr:hypothetical protein [Mucilaginibacter sp.]
MKSQFYILISLRTTRGFKTYGQYFLGNDRKVAQHIFSLLTGDETIGNKTMLHLDFMEMVDELPVKIKTIGCTLEELGCNCKLIAKEIFRISNLNEMKLI